MKKWFLIFSVHALAATWLIVKTKGAEKSVEFPVIGYSKTEEVTLWPRQRLLQVEPIVDGAFEGWEEEVLVFSCDGIYGVIRKNGSIIEIDQKSKRAVVK